MRLPNQISSAQWLLHLCLSGMMHSPGFEGNTGFSFQTLMNADSLYMVSHYTLLLNLKLSNADYYRKKPAQCPVLTVSGYRIQNENFATQICLKSWFRMMNIPHLDVSYIFFYYFLELRFSSLCFRTTGFNHCN